MKASTHAEIPLDQIEADPNQPRKAFDQVLLQELADTVKATGVIQPILVRKHPSPTSEKQYMIVAGERRFIASGLAGLETIPTLIASEEIDSDAIYRAQMTENLNREDLNPVEIGEAIQARVDELTSRGVESPKEFAARELGVSPSWVSKKINVLKFNPKIRALARVGTVRDYSLLSKLNKLKPDQLDKAVALIDSGTFDSKSFFKSVDKPQRVRKPRPPSMAMQLSRTEFVRMMTKTGYANEIARSNPEWQNSTVDEMKSYLQDFKSWALADA